MQKKSMRMRGCSKLCENSEAIIFSFFLQVCYRCFSFPGISSSLIYSPNLMQLAGGFVKGLKKLWNFSTIVLK